MRGAGGDDVEVEVAFADECRVKPLDEGKPRPSPQGEPAEGEALERARRRRVLRRLVRRDGVQLFVLSVSRGETVLV